MKIDILDLRRLKFKKDKNKDLLNKSTNFLEIILKSLKMVKKERILKEKC